WLKSLPPSVRLGLEAGALKWLRSLPPSERVELRTGDTETTLAKLIHGIESQLRYWRELPGYRGRNAGTDLRQCLIGTLDEHLPDARSEAREHKRKCEQLTADILGFARIGFPNPKKDRKKFIGRARTK